MLYLWLKYIHILSSTILFGTGIGTASVMLYGYFLSDLRVKAAIYNYVVKVDWLFTGVTGFLQLVTGLWMVHIAHFPFATLWITGGLIGYSFTAVCWFIVVYLQIKIRNIAISALDTQTPLPPRYSIYFKWWFTLGWPAFISLLLVFYFMIMKPA